MDQNNKLYRQLIKEKSEANLKFIGKSLEEIFADEFDHIAEEAKETEIPKGLDDKLAFLLKEEDLKWKEKERNRRLIMLSKICACILAVILLGTGLMWNVEAFREKVYEMFYYEESDYIDFKPIEIPYDKDGVIPFDWNGFWYPKQLPEGFFLANYTRNDQAINLIFKNKNKETIFFSQVPTEEMHLLVDNEDKSPEKIEINFGTAYWCQGEDGNLLFWDKGETFFLLRSGLPKGNIIEIAEGITYLKK
ncbi:MAG: DUF4367 domain-containing protein [Parabacteroides sp.]|nr:DUF4367 domain-containing protein [Parabacteroides sp.]